MGVLVDTLLWLLFILVLLVNINIALKCDGEIIQSGILTLRCVDECSEQY